MCSINICYHAKSLLVCHSQIGRDKGNVFFCCLFHAVFFQAEDVAQYIQVIIGLKPLMFKRNKNSGVYSASKTMPIRFQLKGNYLFCETLPGFLILTHCLNTATVLEVVNQISVGNSHMSCQIMSWEYWWFRPVHNNEVFISYSFWAF